MELQGTNYDLIYEYREAFNEEAIEEKYVDLLAKYDFSSVTGVMVSFV